MTIYAIGDLHFSGLAAYQTYGKVRSTGPATGTRSWPTGSAWFSLQDLVLVCGDISWGMTLAEAKPDLDEYCRPAGTQDPAQGQPRLLVDQPGQDAGCLSRASLPFCKTTFIAGGDRHLRHPGLDPAGGGRF
jgi:hypothetical protein